VLHSVNRLDIATLAARVRARMTDAVVAGALALAVLNAIPALVGAWLWQRHLAGERSARTFWILLRVGQGSALTLAVAVGSLAAAGKYSSDHLFYLYALLPLAVGFVAEQLRLASTQTVLQERGLQGAEGVAGLPAKQQRLIVLEIVRREIGVMALSALVVVFLALRAAGTAHGF
jgi:hypothetical protein